MPKPLKEVLKENLQNSGLTAATMQAIETGNMDFQVPDAEIEAVEANLGTESKFEQKIVDKHKDKFIADGEKKITELLKAKHDQLAASLTGQKLADYEKLTSEVERNQFLFDHFQNGIGDGDYKALQKKMEKVIAEQKEKYVPKTDYDTLKGEIEPAYQDRINAQITNRANRHKSIAPSRKDEKFFESNFLTEVNTFRESKGYKIDFKTGKVVNEKGEPVIGKNNLPMTHLDLVDAVVEENNEYWGVKSDPPQGGKIITTTQKGATGDPVKDKNRERMRETA